MHTNNLALALKGKEMRNKYLHISNQGIKDGDRKLDQTMIIHPQ